MIKFKNDIFSAIKDEINNILNSQSSQLLSEANRLRQQQQQPTENVIGNSYMPTVTANEPFQNSPNTLNYIDLNNNSSAAISNNANSNNTGSYFTAKPFKFIQNLKSMFTSSSSTSTSGQYPNTNQFNNMQSTFIDQTGQLDENEPRSPSPLLSPQPEPLFNNNNYIEQQQSNYQYQAYITNPPVPPTFMMYKFDYNSQFLFDSFQNLMEKKGLILNNNNNNSNTNSSGAVIDSLSMLNVETSRNSDVELNELDDLAKIKLEDIDELNCCSSSPMNVQRGVTDVEAKLTSGANTQTVTTNAMFATPPANSRSRTNSLVNAIFNFVGSQKK